jgi:hypothetical protein
MMPLPRLPQRGAALAALVAVTAVLGCETKSSSGDKPASAAAAASGSAAAAAESDAPASTSTIGAPVAIPRPASEVAKIINPKGEAPYHGPSGTLKGTIRIQGDPPPDTDLQFPVNPCGASASATYGKLFRVGQDGTVADVLVAVTGYQGFVPAREEAKKITLQGCAFSRRTLALVLGQRIDVSNIDKIESYMPYIDGAPSRATLVAVPGGPPVRLTAIEPGHYMLRDLLPKPFLHADVFVLAYATHDVTGLDGQYEIRDIPVGKVRVSAFLPVIDTVAEQSFEIKEGENKLDLTLTYDSKKNEKKDAAPAKSGEPAKGEAPKSETPKGVTPKK